MIAISPAQPAAIAEKPLVIATDLDGTFLGGDDALRAAFYRWIEKNRDRIGLIFVTGRDPGFIQAITRDQGVPVPDYVVADVGTTIAAFDDNDLARPIDALEVEIAQGWNDAGDRVRSALQGIPGLRLQPTGFRYRVSYDLDPDRFDTRALEIVADLGLDTLISADRFLDVLPKGISKGPSLLRLISHLGIDGQRCLIAGDTLNDLTMFDLGLPAVAVRNSEPQLIERIDGYEHVHLANRDGVGGIIEAIVTFEFLTRQAA